MRKYELVLVFKSSLSLPQRKKLLETVKGWLKGVKIEKEDDWGPKTLGYPIKKQTTGHYVLLSLESETMPVGVEKRIIGNEDILRHLMLRKK